MDDLGFPPELDRDDVRKAMACWLDHHRAIGKPYRSIPAVQALLRKFVSKGPARFIAAVEHSMGNNWQGLFEPDERFSTKSGPGQRYDPTAHERDPNHGKL